jgi:hypothetical protein
VGPELAQVVVLVAAQVVVLPVAAQLLAVVLQQAELPLQVAQQQPVRRQLQPQPRLVWWRLVWLLRLWWLQRWPKRPTPPTRPLPLCLARPPFTRQLVSPTADF